MNKEIIMEFTKQEKEIICDGLQMLSNDNLAFLDCYPDNEIEIQEAEKSLKICEDLYEKLSGKKIIV